MKISLVAAMANNRVIGKDNDMPWHMPADLAHFKKVTMSKPIVMGRKTYESIGRPLPGRLNIVISRDPDFSVDGVTVVSGPEQAIAAAGPVEELMIIGGGKIYDLFLPKATRLYLTQIDLNVEGDTHFPDYESLANWSIVEKKQCSADEKNLNDYCFVVFERD